MATTNELAERMAVLETTVDLGFKHLNERLDKLADDLSDQGKPPVPRSGLGSLVPASWTPAAVAQAFLILIPVLAGVWGVSYSGAQSGGSSGATTAVETAVEQGEAVPVAPPPTLRVLPVPTVVPVPVPQPPVPEPDPVVRPDDPLMGER